MQTYRFLPNEGSKECTKRSQLSLCHRKNVSPHNFCPGWGIITYEFRHVGVCCPDDIALSGYEGSQIIQDLPGGGDDYENENTTGEFKNSQ